MISTEARKFILKLIIVSVCFKRANGCDSNKQLYTDIGCKPIYANDSTSSSCPIAYDCENVFRRPNNKCYFRGNLYEPRSHLSESDSALNNPCLAACFCDQRTYNNETTTKFTCAHVECPRYFAPLMKPCYHQFSKDHCCEINTHCPEQKAIVHECTYDGQVYKDGQQIYVHDNYQCVCSPDFTGTPNDKTCRKIDCSFEILYMEKILKRSAPVYFENVNGCPIDWYHPEFVTITSEKTPIVSTTSSHDCKFGDLSFSIGQKLNIGEQSDNDTYNTTCSCNTPPLVTCTKVRK